MDCKAIKIDGYDEALVGISDIWDSTGKTEEHFVYNGEEIAQILMRRDGMDIGSAMEFIAANIEGAYVGPNTPVIVWPTYGEEE